MPAPSQSGLSQQASDSQNNVYVHELFVAVSRSDWHYFSCPVDRQIFESKAPNHHLGEMMLYVGPHEGRAHPEVRLDEAGYPMPSNFIQQVPPNQGHAKNFVRGFVEYGKD